jgi:hypothetical protein
VGFDSTKLETPTIVKSLGPEPTPLSRAAAKSQQVISNRQAYDSIYLNHKSWYDEKKFIVIDKNFEMMESDLLGQLRNNLDSKFNLTAIKNIKHVDQIDQTNINVKEMNFGSIHKVHPDTVEYKDKYVDNFSETNKPKVTSSDPYNEITGKRY